MGYYYYCLKKQAASVKQYSVIKILIYDAR